MRVLLGLPETWHQHNLQDLTFGTSKIALSKRDPVTAQDISRDRNLNLMTRGDKQLDPRHNLHFIIRGRVTSFFFFFLNNSVFLELL